MPPFDKIEQRVANYYRHHATVDDFGDTFAYMNCIEIEDHNTVDITPEFIVTETHNDSIELHAIIKWDRIDTYIDNILHKGLQDDIECLYYFIKEKL
jgi:hypothetical protein